MIRINSGSVWSVIKAVPLAVNHQGNAPAVIRMAKTLTIIRLTRDATRSALIPSLKKLGM